jgi:hypothetical protein
MSLTIKDLKIISIIAFLMIPGLDENIVQTFALLAIGLFQFIHDLFNDFIFTLRIGLFVIPIFTALVVFYKCKSYKILIICVLSLVIPLMQAIGVIRNSSRIDFWFIFTFATFIITSIAVIILAQKENKL